MIKSKKTPEYLHKRVVDVPLYSGKLVVVLTNSVGLVQKHIHFDEEDSVFAHALYRNWKGIQGFIVILNFDGNGSTLTHGVVAHEALHIANFIARERGFIPTINNDEPMAYLINWVVDEIYKTMKKFNKKIEL